MSTHVRQEQRFTSFSGYPVVGAALLAVAAAVWMITGEHVGVFVPYLLIALAVFLGAGLYMLQPNETAVLTLFGRYMGTAPDARLVSIKVSDDHGNAWLMDVIAGLQFVARHHLVEEVAVVHLGGGERAAGEDHLLELAQSHHLHPGPHPRTPAVVPERRVAEERIIGGDHQIGVGALVEVPAVAVALRLDDADLL